MSRAANPTFQSGFTIIELVIVMPIIAFVVVGLVVTMTELLDQLTGTDTKASTAYGTEKALDYLEQDARLTSSFYATPNDGASSSPPTPWFSDAYAPSGGWNVNTAYNGFKPVILRMRTTTLALANPNKQPIFVNTYGCDPTVETSNPFLYADIVYYVKNATLYRRVLMDTNNMSNTCDPPYQVQTCPPDATPPLDASCKGVDVAILSNVSALASTYYTGDSPGVVVDTSSTTGAIATAQGLSLAVSTTVMASGHASVYSSAAYVNRINS